MLKNDHGITLSALIVTIIVILILASISLNTTDLLLQDTRAKAVVSNMYLVKGKIESLYDDYIFRETETALVGSKVTDLEVLKEYGVTPAGNSSDDLWYVIDKGNLLELGMDQGMLYKTAQYIVNYETGDVIYTLGFKDATRITRYKLSDIQD